MIDLDQHDRFVVTRRPRTSGAPGLGKVDVYTFELADASADTPPFCHVRQRVARCPTRIGFYADEACTVPVMHLNARLRFDPWARHELTDADLWPIGAIQKVFEPRRRRSHYVLFDRDGEEVARVDARLSAAVTRRRAGRVAVVAGAGLVGIPVIGAAGVAAVTSLAVTAAIRQLRDWVDPIDIASELRLSRDGEPLGVFVRRSLAGTVGPGSPPIPGPWGSSVSLYEIDLGADGGRTVDRRLALAVPVAMDALRGVLAESPLR